MAGPTTKVPSRPLCGATNSRGSPCGNQAGAGTDHPGEGTCYVHEDQEPTPEAIQQPPATKEGAICADYGGASTHTGAPCRREAGWGTDHLGEGRCKDHAQEAEAERQQIKEEILDLMQSGDHTQKSAALKLGMNPTTVWKWRQSDSEFDAEVEAADLAGMRNFLSEWEANIRKRILGGATAAALERFYITNIDKRIADATGRARRWRYRQHMEISGPGGGPIETRRVDPGQLDDQELETLDQLLRRAQVPAPSEN